MFLARFRLWAIYLRMQLINHLFHKLDQLSSFFGQNLKETYVVAEKGGEPVINPNTKLPIMEWNHEVESRILTKEQYDAIVASGFEDDES